MYIHTKLKLWSLWTLKDLNCICKLATQEKKNKKT